MSPTVEDEDRPATASAAAAPKAAHQQPNGHALDPSPLPDDAADVKPLLPVSAAGGEHVIAASPPSSRGRKRRKTESSSSLSPPRPAAAAAAAAAAANEESRRMFQKLWTDADEMTILQGFLEFTSARGTTHADYQHDTGPFYEQIRGSLRLDFTKNQIAEKLRRLKKKYRNMASRITSDKAFAFRSHHDEGIFQIASKIWNPTFKRSSSSSKPPHPLDEDDFDDEDDEYEGFAAVDQDNNFAAPPAAQEGGGGGGGISSEDTANSSVPAEAVEVAVPAAAFPGRSNAASAAAPHPVTAGAPPPEMETVAAGVARRPGPKTEAEEAPVWSSSSANHLGELPAAALNEQLLRPLVYPWSLGDGSGAAGGGGGGGGGGVKHPLDGKWKRQHILELEVYLKRLDLLHEHVQSKLEELRSQSLPSSSVG